MAEDQAKLDIGTLSIKLSNITFVKNRKKLSAAMRIEDMMQMLKINFNVGESLSLAIVFRDDEKNEIKTLSDVQGNEYIVACADVERFEFPKRLTWSSAICQTSLRQSMSSFLVVAKAEDVFKSKLRKLTGSTEIALNVNSFGLMSALNESSESLVDLVYKMEGEDFTSFFPMDTKVPLDLDAFVMVGSTRCNMHMTLKASFVLNPTFSKLLVFSLCLLSEAVLFAAVETLEASYAEVLFNFYRLFCATPMCNSLASLHVCSVTSPSLLFRRDCTLVRIISMYVRHNLAPIIEVVSNQLRMRWAAENFVNSNNTETIIEELAFLSFKDVLHLMATKKPHLCLFLEMTYRMSIAKFPMSGMNSVISLLFLRGVMPAFSSIDADNRDTSAPNIPLLIAKAMMRLLIPGQNEVLAGKERKRHEKAIQDLRKLVNIDGTSDIVSRVPSAGGLENSPSHKSGMGGLFSGLFGKGRKMSDGVASGSRCRTVSEAELKRRATGGPEYPSQRARSQTEMSPPVPSSALRQRAHATASDATGHSAVTAGPLLKEKKDPSSDSGSASPSRSIADQPGGGVSKAGSSDFMGDESQLSSKSDQGVTSTLDDSQENVQSSRSAEAAQPAGEGSHDLSQSLPAVLQHTQVASQLQRQMKGVCLGSVDPRKFALAKTPSGSFREGSVGHLKTIKANEMIGSTFLPGLVNLHPHHIQALIDMFHLLTVKWDCLRPAIEATLEQGKYTLPNLVAVLERFVGDPELSALPSKHAPKASGVSCERPHSESLREVTTAATSGSAADIRIAFARRDSAPPPREWSDSLSSKDASVVSEKDSSGKVSELASKDEVPGDGKSSGRSSGRSSCAGDEGGECVKKIAKLGMSGSGDSDAPAKKSALDSSCDDDAATPQKKKTSKSSLSSSNDDDTAAKPKKTKRSSSSKDITKHVTKDRSVSGSSKSSRLHKRTHSGGTGRDGARSKSKE